MEQEYLFQIFSGPIKTARKMFQLYSAIHPKTTILPRPIIQIASTLILLPEMQKGGIPPIHPKNLHRPLSLTPASSTFTLELTKPAQTQIIQKNRLDFLQATWKGAYVDFSIPFHDIHGRQKCALETNLRSIVKAWQEMSMTKTFVYLFLNIFGLTQDVHHRFMIRQLGPTTGACE